MNKIPSALLKLAEAEYFCNVTEFLYVGSGQKLSPQEVLKVKTKYSSAEDWYASLTPVSRVKIITHLKRNM
jgi:hypothetical protein